MDLSSLKPSKGATKNRKRVGRGPGSGHGKTSCRGHKGQNSRSGGGTPPGFEGGQMPLQRRLPKRGFTNIFKKQISLVKVQDLNRFEKDSIVDPAALLQSGLIKGVNDGIKLLGNGEIDRPLVVRIHKWSQSAYEKITAAGGKIERV
ncbi:MAG: 50S ribosomal protein L15 [Deltaproteobacteria bacterium]|nr:50S ribosomal protein L15 [Deltaproteobacteria bacterium]